MSELSREIHDKIDQMLGEITEMKVHLAYLRETRIEIQEEIHAIDKRLDSLEKSRDELHGSFKATKIVGGLAGFLLLMLEVVAIWLSIR